MELNIVPDDVVISGIGGHFPKAENLIEFKKRLYENKSLLEPHFEDDELDICPVLGVINYDHFDNTYFGIHRKQCLHMDPMHWRALECTFSALIDAGVNPHELNGKRVGVFFGSTIGEQDPLFMNLIESGYGLTGTARAMMPNRISYWLDLKGPSIAYDCNWTSGIEVLRLAHSAIKTGQCDSVIIGTAGISRYADIQWLYQDMGYLSKDGSTRAFDENATGYGRSDGVVVLYIQRASEARRSYASIMHIATRFDGNHDGGIRDIGEANLTEFLEEFYQKCPIKPDDIDYVETYGCGSKTIDELELNSIEKVLCKNRKKPLQVTSVKTVAGHSEASASLFSIVQVLLAMEEGVIPATIQHETPNSRIPGLTNGNLEVVTKNKKWSGDYAAVNALGIDSYFGHVVFKKNSKGKVERELDMPTLIVASTRTDEGLNTLFESVKSKPKDPEYYKLIHEVFSRPIKKHLNRGYLLLGEGGPKQETGHTEGNKRPIWFVYSGMGSQWNGMLGDLMKIGVFANSIKKSHDILASKGLDLMHIISTKDETIFNTILNSFVGIAAIQIALTDVLKTLGIEPDGIIGHSVGELGCAYADGCMTAEQMILSSYYRGMASLEATLIDGMMAAIGLGYEQIKNRLPPTIEVACHNSPDSCTLSGPTEQMEKIVGELQAEGVFARLVNVAGIAYHSQYIKPAAPLLLTYLKKVLDKPVQRSSKWISTSNPESTWNTHLARHSSAEYHTNNLLSSVLFEEGCRHIPKDAILIEIAPHGLLQAILKRSFDSVTNVSLTQRQCASSVEFLLESLGKLYLAGLDMNLSNIYPNVEYPVSRNTPSLTDLVHWLYAENFPGFNLTNTKNTIKDVMVNLRSEKFSECVGHQLNERYILPTSFYLDILLECGQSFVQNATQIVYENLHFRIPISISKTEVVPISGFVHEVSGEFEVYANEDLLLTGRMVVPLSGEEFELDKAEVELDAENVELTGSDFYHEMHHRGYKYSGTFKTLKNITLGEDGSVSTVEWKNDWKFLVEAMIQQQLFLTGERNQEVQVPKFIQKIGLSFPSLSNDRTEFEVTYEYATSTISTDGIEVTGMTTVLLDSEDNLHFGGVECVPLVGTYKNIEAAIDFSIQLAEMDYIGRDTEIVFVTELRTENSLSRTITDVLNTLPYNVNFTSVEEVSRITLHSTYPQLFVVNGTASDDILRLTLSAGALLLTKSNKALLSHSELIPVAQFNVGVEEYVILRKISGDNSRIINVKGDNLSTKDLKRPSLSWVAELHAAIEESSATQHAVYLISTLIPAEGFYNFVQELKSLPNTRNVKVVFNLDKKPLDLKRAIQRDLTLTILKGGVWYAYLPFSSQYRDDIELVNVPLSSVAENQTIEYISVNLRDETLNPAIQKRKEVGNIDYSGVSKNGNRVMGLARLDKDTSKFLLDPLLSWPVPKVWSLLDGVTVPHAYTSAYYMLMVVAKLKPGDTVLIHAGCSPIGSAAASIANYHGCFVYVTVSTNTQRAFMAKHFSFLKESNILSSNDSSFRTKLMKATSGKGAEVILNCVSGSLLQSSLDCIANYGRFIQYGKYDTEEGNSIGMYCFLRNPTFFVVDLNDICFEPKNIKEELFKLVSEGLRNLVVRPLMREVVTRNDVENMLRKMGSSANMGKIVLKVSDDIGVNKLNVKKANKYICDAKQSYLVYGGSAENWIDIVEWLVLHGAKRIVVSADAKPTQNCHNRRLSLLQTHFDVHIIMTSSKAHTKEAATELLSEVSTLGPVKLVFNLPNETNPSDIRPLLYLDSALRTAAPKAVLVNFVKFVAGFCYTRAEAGFATYNIQWPNPLEITDGISILDGVLNSKVSNVVARKRQIDRDEDTKQGTIKDLMYVIPSIEELIREQKNATQEPEWIQVVSEGPKEFRGLAPVFIVPGLTGHREVEGMIKRLLLPTFVTVPPATYWSINKMAEVYAKKMRVIYPKGVFNIVSSSTGGVLAIEIARILQKEKASIHLFFIDSAPDKIQQAFKELGESTNDRALNLLKRVFDIEDSEIVRRLTSTNQWENRIKICLDSYDFTARQKNLVQAGLCRLQNQIGDICAFRPNDVLVSGRVHLLVPNVASLFDTCGLELYCRATPTVTLVPGDHLSIMSHSDATEYINTNHWLI